MPSQKLIGPGSCSYWTASNLYPHLRSMNAQSSIMALRRSASAIGRSLHPFTTTSRRSEEQTQSTSPSSSSGFGALQDIFATPSPLPSSSSNVSTTGFLRPVIPTLTEAGRGYDPRALPPKIDPVIDMFTNLLMKHGRKAEAQGKVAKILSMLFVLPYAFFFRSDLTDG